MINNDQFSRRNVLQKCGVLCGGLAAIGAGMSTTVSARCYGNGLFFSSQEPNEGAIYIVTGKLPPKQFVPCTGKASGQQANPDNGGKAEPPGQSFIQYRVDLCAPSGSGNDPQSGIIGLKNDIDLTSGQLAFEVQKVVQECDDPYGTDDAAQAFKVTVCESACPDP